MEMKKMKMSSEPQDRLSELPDSLILSIFELLPMNDVVRTQILSHRWKNLWTTNLKIQTINGAYGSKCLVMNVSSLTHATLAFEGLTLSDCCIKVVGATSSNSLPSLLPSVVYLNLNGSFEEHEQIVGFLEIFPKLKTLVIREKYKYDDDLTSKKNFKPNPSKSFLVELTTVEVIWNMRDFSIFPLIEILLKYASKLEEMVFRAVMPPTVPPSASTISWLVSESQTELLRMPSSSPTAKVIFYMQDVNNNICLSLEQLYKRFGFDFS